MQETPRYAVPTPWLEGAGIDSEWMLCCKKVKSLAGTVGISVSLKEGFRCNNNDSLFVKNVSDWVEVEGRQVVYIANCIYSGSI